MTRSILAAIVVFAFTLGCGERVAEKGFAVTASESDDTENSPNGFSKDSLRFPTRPGSVLLTGNQNHRLLTIYKVNFRKDSSTFIGSNNFYYRYEESGQLNENRWHNNYLPGLEALYGYNLINVAHFNTETHAQQFLFDKPVLIKTLYYPAFTKDTLNFKPVLRNYYLASVYDEDTNKDGLINARDIRRIYSFDVNGGNAKPVVPLNCSVYKSEYDPANDLLFVFATLDKNQNGTIEDLEPVQVFWVDLKDPGRTGRYY